MRGSAAPARSHADRTREELISVGSHQIHTPTSPHVVALVSPSSGSETIVGRTAELSHQFGASVRTVRADWEELPDHFDDDTFDMVFCVGNSLHHAEGAERRFAALESMARLLRPGGRLVPTSRTWELVGPEAPGRISVTDSSAGMVVMPAENYMMVTSKRQA